MPFQAADRDGCARAWVDRLTQQRSNAALKRVFESRERWVLSTLGLCCVESQSRK